jgi:hypothetical protein
MAKDFIPLSDVAACGATMIDIRCGRCDRHGRLSVQRLLARYGPDAAMGHVMREQIGSCPHRNDAQLQTRCDLEWVRSDKPITIESDGSMNNRDARWREFEGLGEEEVRKRVGAKMFGEEKSELAQQWLGYRASEDFAEQGSKTLALAEEAIKLARSANDIARKAADSASRSAAAAERNSRIARGALIGALIAIAISIIGLIS